MAISWLNNIKKKIDTIFFSITFVFVIALSSVSATFWLYLKLDKEQQLDNILNRYIVAARMLLTHNPFFYTIRDAQRDLQTYGLDIVIDPNILKNILKNASLLKHKTLPKGEANILLYKKQIYIFVSIFQRQLLLKDYTYHPYHYGFTALAFFTTIFLLLISYFIILKKIYPLKKLREKIIRFGNGELNQNFKINANHEIADVANEFNKAAKQIKNLINSRTLFLRNIMHELKTPITKGKLTIEMIPDNKHKERLKNVFYRLESLINEFASIEKITSGINENDFNIYRMIDLVDNAIDLAMVEKEQINLIITKDYKVNVNFEFFSVAIKNMIDNGIKYSNDQKVNIHINDNTITFSNTYKKLNHPLDYYTEPFTKEETQNKNSFGLGLYIVHNILKSHRMQLNYHYKNNNNYFSFNSLV